MEQKTQSPKFLRQRKFFMVLPLLVLPFISLMFWALGGGKDENAIEQAQTQKGFNMSLPEASLNEDKPLDKMSYYEQAAQDSAKMKGLMKNDPYYNNETPLFLGAEEAYGNGISLPPSGYSAKTSGLKTSPYIGGAYKDPNEAKVYKKLEQLNKALNNSAATEIETDDYSIYDGNRNASINTADVDRLKQMMQTMGHPGGEDPEIQQLNGMLEKILDIQHPGRVQEKLRETSEARKGEVFAVSAKGNNLVSLLDNSRPAQIGYDSNIHFVKQSNAFYSLEEMTAVDDSQKTIEAVFHETRTIVTGSTVKLRLVNDIYINGILILKDNFLFGMASLNGERLNIKINSIRFQHSLFPVELSVYDMDGMHGIYIPGAIARDVAKQSADRAIQGYSMTTLDPSLGAQAVSAGIEAAKSLFSKKVKLVKVTVKAGYKVLLMDGKQRQIGQ